MAERAIRGRARADEFTRLHRLFVEHLGYGVSLVWAIALVGAAQAPWLRNIRGLIDPAGRPESTLSFLFTRPAAMGLAWLCAAFGADLLRRTTVAKRLEIEFGVAALVALAIGCMAVGRVLTAVSLAS